MKLFERVDWTDTLLFEPVKQVVENILFCAGDRLHIEKNTGFEVEHTLKNDKALYNKNLA